jgi:hypothetical protein
MMYMRTIAFMGGDMKMYGNCMYNRVRRLCFLGWGGDWMYNIKKA